MFLPYSITKCVISFQTNTKESSASTGALSVCTKNVTDQMWLISEYINLRQARQMAMSINISCVPRCVAIRFKQQGQDNALPLPNVRELNLADFIQFSTQDNSTSEKTISSAVTHNGTFVLFQTSNNNSHCLTIKSLKIHYNYCPNVSVNLAYFKETPSPPLKKNNEIDHVDVTGVCQLNAVPTNPAVRARMSCDSTGKWKFKSGCHCSAGFEMVIASCSSK